MVKQRIERNPSLPLELMGQTRRRGYSLVEDDEPETPVRLEPPEIQPLRSIVGDQLRKARVPRPKLPASLSESWNRWKREVWSGKREPHKPSKAGFFSKPIHGFGLNGQVPHLLKKESAGKPFRKLIDQKELDKKRLRPVLDCS